MNIHALDLRLASVTQCNDPSQSLPQCAHCGEEFSASGSLYCCEGCRSAATLIQKLGLESFYRQRQERHSPRLLTRYLSIDLLRPKHFDDIDEVNKAHSFYNFKVIGIQCFNCVWLIESALRQKFPSMAIELNQASGHLRAKRLDDISPGEIVDLIQGLGFRVQPFATQQNSQAHMQLLRLGVALFVFLNVMVLASADYFPNAKDMSGTFFHLFRYIQLFLSSCAVGFCAYPILLSALQSVGQFRLTVDMPLALAILLGFFYSAYNALSVPPGPIFFDTLTAIIALILVARFGLDRAMARLRSRFDVKPIEDPIIDFLEKDGSIRKARLSSINANDCFWCLPGDTVAVKSILESDYGVFSREKITGEAQCWEAKRSESIESGSIVNSGQRVLLRAQESIETSHLQKLQELGTHFDAQKGFFGGIQKSFTSLWFLLIVIPGITGSILLHLREPLELFKTVIAILLVACPCGFALALPLVYSRAAKLGADVGVFFRCQRAIESLGRIDTIFFDKTGTLTSGSLQVLSEKRNDSLIDREWQNIRAYLKEACRRSRHHHARALEGWLEGFPAVLDEKNRLNLVVKEVWGEGLDFSIGDSCYQLRSHATPSSTSGLKLECQGQVLVEFCLADPAPKASLELLKKLKRKVKNLILLSGDQKQRCAEFAALSQVPWTQIISQATPEEKAKAVDQERALGNRVAMVGNGYNDQAAFRASDVGIAVWDALSSTKESADVLLAQPNIQTLLDGMAIARKARRISWSIFIVSIFYNIVATSLAVNGNITPFIAAILMPISSLTLTTIALRWRPKED